MMLLLFTFINIAYLSHTSESLKEQFNRLVSKKIQEKDYLTISPRDAIIVHGIYIKLDKILVRKFSAGELVEQREIQIKDFIDEEFNLSDKIQDEIFKIICEFKDRFNKILYIKNIEKRPQLKNLTDEILNYHNTIKIISKYFNYKEVIINNLAFEEIFYSRVKKEKFYILQKFLNFNLEKIRVINHEICVDKVNLKINLEDFTLNNAIQSKNFKVEKSKQIVDFFQKNFSFSFLIEKSIFKCSDNFIYNFINCNFLKADSDIFSRDLEISIIDDSVILNNNEYKISEDSAELPLKMFNEILDYLHFISELDFYSVKIILKLMNILSKKNLFTVVLKRILHSNNNGRKKLLSAVLYSLGKISNTEHYWLEYSNTGEELKLVENILNRFMIHNIFLKALAALYEEIYSSKQVHYIFIIFLEISKYLQENSISVNGIDLLPGVILKDLPSHPAFKMPFKIITEFESSTLDFSQDILFLKDLSRIFEENPTFNSLQ